MEQIFRREEAGYPALASWVSRLTTLSCARRHAAPYLAVHSIHDAAMLDQNIYREAGGGTFSGWGDLATNLVRNLFAGMEVADEVSDEQCFVMLDDLTSAHEAFRMEFAWLANVGLDRTTKRRGLANVGRATGESL